MRTVVAPLEAEVEQQLAGLDASLRRVAEGCIARLRLEPFQGHLLRRGLLGSYAVRAVYFDRDSRPQELLGEHRGPLRLAGEDASKGPRYRVVYRVAEAPTSGVRVVRVLAVGEGHPSPGSDGAYRDAERLLRAQIKADQKRRKR
jgi:hypothetical protein